MSLSACDFKMILRNILGLCCIYAVASNKLAKRQIIGDVPPQNPPVFQALDQLRGSEALSATQIQQVLASSYPGSSYPTYSYIPQTSFSCNQVRTFGFYADPETRCQVFRRCEANNYMFSYICPNGTVFNQITLICDWFYNVNCPSVGGFYDYSNPRIYRQDLRLFDDYNNGIYGNSGAGPYGGAAAGAGPYGAASGLASASYGASGANMIGSYANPVPAVALAMSKAPSSSSAANSILASAGLLPQTPSLQNYRLRSDPQAVDSSAPLTSGSGTGASYASSS